MQDFDDLSQLVRELESGDPAELQRYLPAIYRELRTLARNKMRGERADHTLSPTALVHEVYLRLVGEGRHEIANRAHFLALASRAMRQVLIDHARSRGRQKRGGGSRAITLTAALGVAAEETVDVLALDDALTRLGAAHPRKAEVVEMLYFGGLSASETAQLMGVSERTVERDWQTARLWLLREMDTDHNAH